VREKDSELVDDTAILDEDLNEDICISPKDIAAFYAPRDLYVATSFPFKCITRATTCVSAATCVDPSNQVRKSWKRRYWTRVRVVASFKRLGGIVLRLTRGAKGAGTPC